MFGGSRDGYVQKQTATSDALVWWLLLVTD